MKPSSFSVYDFKNITRDPMLLLSSAAPVLITLVTIFGFQATATLALQTWQLDISPYYPQVAVFFSTIMPMMLGMVYGFILLDERDAGLITNLAVTPLGRGGYLRLRLVIPTLFSFVVVFAFLRITAAAPQLAFWQLFLAAAVLALGAPIMILFLGAFADNKVEGVALSKAYGVLLLFVVADFMISAPWALLTGISPLVWAVRALLTDSVPMFLGYWAVGMIYHLLLLAALMRRFLKRMD